MEICNTMLEHFHLHFVEKKIISLSPFAIPFYAYEKIEELESPSTSLNRTAHHIK